MTLGTLSFCAFDVKESFLVYLPAHEDEEDGTMLINGDEDLWDIQFLGLQ
jgi:hypothetical protein